MRSIVTSLMALLMVLTASVGTVTATGNSRTSLNACTNSADDYYGGIKVYARDRGKGASRVMCPPTEEIAPSAAAQREGFRFDRNLNSRNNARPPLEDIWNGFRKNIESFRLRAAPGCVTIAFLAVTDRRPLLRRVLDNAEGGVAKTKLYEVPRRKDNKATKVLAAVVCPADETSP